MKRLILVPLLVTFVVGCTQITLIGPQTRKIGDIYAVEPQIQWAKFERGKFETWT